MVGSNGLHCNCRQTVNGGTRTHISRDSALSETTAESPVTVGHNMLMDSGFQEKSNRIPSTYGPLTDGQRRSLLRQLPECLVVQLMRFSVDSKTRTPVKNQRPVKVPITDLDLTHLIVDNVMKREDLTTLNASYRYDLYAMCLHVDSDTVSHGHYIAYVKSNDTGTWYKCDDEAVTPVNIEYEVSTRQVRENVYLLLYHKNRTSPNAL